MKTRKTDATVVPEAVARSREDATKRANAMRRLIGSYLLGAISSVKIMSATSQAHELPWLLAFLLAFGIANVDQVLKALGRE